MHQSSFEKMAEFLDRYYSNDGIVRKVLDFGSKDVNGTYRSLFPTENWKYLGLDLEEGENVDLVPKDPYRWNEVKDGMMDLVISGQALEHIDFPWKTFEIIKRILKPNGLCCVIAPSAGPEHKHPVDCWRFYPDGMKSLCKHAGLECLEINTDWNPKKYKDGSALWKDTLLLARKPEPKPIPRIKAKAPKKFSPRYESEVTSWHPHREFAYDLMAELKPKILVELGVHHGDSYFTFCQAREEHELETLCYGIDHWKGDEQSGLYGEEVCDEVNEYNAEFYSDFSNLLRMDFDEALKEFDDESINLLHIDGSHDYESVSGHFESWLPKIKQNGVILIHDINVKREDFGVEKFWGELKNKFFTKSQEKGHGLGIVLIGTSTDLLLHESHEMKSPLHQNAVDIFDGLWASKYPKSFNLLTNGWAKAFEDDRIAWAFERMGGVRDAKGLELGPLEGGHSYMAQMAGIDSLLAIESNRIAYLKCLVTKELLGLDKVSYRLGDFVKYLEDTEETFDFALASGVLYHVQNPIETFQLLLTKASSVFVWTHFYDKDLVALNPNLQKKFTPRAPFNLNGKTYECAAYHYQNALELKGFCGGMHSDATWFEKRAWLNICLDAGFETEVYKDEPRHQNGPAFSFLAMRKA